MNFRLQQFLSAENISQAQFADTIGVARASVSHILAGRNKPGFDFIQNMSRHYPNLNLEWLISGKGRMYKDGGPTQQNAMQGADDQLFAPLDPKPAVSTLPSIAAVQDSPDPTAAPSPAETLKINDLKASPKVTVQPGSRKITRIVVFYDDNTYQELKEA